MKQSKIIYMLETYQKIGGDNKPHEAPHLVARGECKQNMFDRALQHES